MKNIFNAALPIILITMLIAGCASGGASNSIDIDAVDVDVDLTRLSETVLSAELMNILANSKDYIGKTIKVSGIYSFAFHEPSGEIYHYVITKQGDACCQEGLEFIWAGDHVFPDDYPAMGTPIVVYGEFTRYQGEGFRHFYLAIDDIHLLG